MDRRRALTEYLHSVVDDLIARGIIRRQEGRSWFEILKTEPKAVLESVVEELVAVGKQIGLTYGASGARVLRDVTKQAVASGVVDRIEGGVDRFFDGVFDAIGEMLGGGKKRHR